jgi:hypothetical protein
VRGWASKRALSATAGRNALISAFDVRPPGLEPRTRRLRARGMTSADVRGRRVLAGQPSSTSAVARGDRADAEYVGGDPNFDLAWRDPATVVEVKSLTNANESGQIRLGLGQVLHFQHILELAGEPSRAVLAVESEPSGPEWLGLCARHDVQLVWPATFHTLFEPAWREQTGA